MINYIENPTKSILIDGMPAAGSIFFNVSKQGLCLNNSLYSYGDNPMGQERSQERHLSDYSQNLL